MTYELRLYVAGQTRHSVQARRHLEAVCAEFLSGRCRVEVIDVLEDPVAAERDRILATPTLVRVAPAPERRLIGDLSDRESLLLGLDLGGGQA